MIGGIILVSTGIGNTVSLLKLSQIVSRTYLWLQFDKNKCAFMNISGTQGLYKYMIDITKNTIDSAYDHYGWKQSQTLLYES